MNSSSSTCTTCWRARNHTPAAASGGWRAYKCNGAGTQRAPLSCTSCGALWCTVECPWQCAPTKLQGVTPTARNTPARVGCCFTQQEPKERQGRRPSKEWEPCPISPLSNNPHPAQPHATHRKETLARAAVSPTPTDAGTCCGHPTSTHTHTRTHPRQRRFEGPHAHTIHHTCVYTLLHEQQSALSVSPATPIHPAGHPAPLTSRPSSPVGVTTTLSPTQQTGSAATQHTHTHTDTSHATDSKAQRLACRYALAPKRPAVCSCVVAPTKQKQTHVTA